MKHAVATQSFATLISVLPEAVLIASSAGVIQAANESACQLLRCTADELSGCNIAQFVPEEAEALAAFLRAAARSRALVPAGLEVVNRDRRAVPCRFEGAVLQPRSGDTPAILLVRIVPKEAAVNRFVTLNLRIEELAKEIIRRQRAEAALSEQHELLRITLGSIGDAVMATDALGRITFMNRVAETLTGWPASDAMGRDLPEVFVIVNETTRENVESPVAKVLREGVTVGLANHTVLIGRDGEVRPIDDSGAPIRSPSGKILGVVLVFRDVTERRAMERDRAEADRRKDQFLAMLAHELRNPLAALGNGINYFCMLQNKAPSPDPATVELGNSMQRQLRHLARLVDDLLDVSRITTGKIVLRKTEVPLQTIIEHAIETCKPALQAREIDVRVALPAERIAVEADAARLSQVFCNLLNNAAKFSESRGKVSITLEREGGAAVARVSDAGVGISADMLPRIFDLFVQENHLLAGSESGLGVGLTVAKLITEMHGGRIEARSEGAGRGSEFIVRLPAVVRDTKPAARTLESVAAAERRRILVVDDNADAALSFTLLLRLAGHDVRTAYSGREALQLAATIKPEIVLLDVGMPGMDGYEVARRLRADDASRNCIIIAVTGFGAEADRIRTREAGFDGHLIKPVDVKALEALISRRSGT